MGTVKKKNPCFNHLRSLLRLAGIFCMGSILLSVFLLLSTAGSQTDTRKMRVDFNNLIHQAENGTLSPTKNTQYVLFDTQGTVIRSTDAGYPIGETVDLHTLSGDGGFQPENGMVRFAAPVIRQGVLSGMLLVTARQEAYTIWSPPLFPVFCLMILGAGCVIFLWRAVSFTRSELFLPLQALHQSVRRMLQGNLETRLHYDDDGEIGALCHDFESMRDVLSNSFRHEEERLQNDKYLYACVSHDLKTPLAAISGYAEELRDGLATEPSEIRQKGLRIMERVRRLTALVDDILEETQIQLGRLSYCEQETYSQPFFQSVCQECSLDTAQAGIKLTVHEIPNVLLVIDQKRITQVVQNLISNSVKYTPQGGKIDVRFTVHTQELVVVVNDTGNGISANDLPFIFDRFYRGDVARSQNIPGSGLGLSIVKAIVEHYGGRVECDSVLGSGTEISFSIPFT